MTHRPIQSIPAFTSTVLKVVDGANLGDTIAIADEVQFDDIYHLASGAKRERLSIVPNGELGFEIAENTALGVPGNTLHLDSCVTFMVPDGFTTECIIAVEVDENALIEEIYVLPLQPLLPKVDYRIIGVERGEARRKFAQIGAVSFTRGTKITLATGEQRAIEDLKAGDLVLTRDAGPQEVRWIGSTTMKAEGEFAPILIKAGTLNNLDDLTVSPEHRLFIYQRQDAVGAGRSEILVRARHLLNGQTVTQENGGYVDYFQILFDEHQIIYAEGIAAESFLVDHQTKQALPEDLTQLLNIPMPGRDTGLRREFEIGERLIDRATKSTTAADLLRRASTR